MFSKLGIFLLVSGFIAWLLGGISGFVKGELDFTDLTLSTLSEEIAASAVDMFSSQTIQDLLYTIFYEINLGALLAGAGVFFLVISMCVKEH